MTIVSITMLKLNSYGSIELKYLWDMFAIGRVFLFFPYLLSLRVHEYIKFCVSATLVNVKPALVQLSRRAESDVTIEL